MKKTGTFLILFFFLAVVKFYAQDVNVSLPPEAWRADLRQLVEQVSKLHPNAFHHLSATDFAAQVAAIEKQVGNKTNKEIVIALIKLLAGIGDGNTRVDWQNTGLQQYPIQLHFFEDELRVVAADSIYQRWLGYGVLKIDQFDIPQIQEKLLPLVPSKESPNHALYLMQQYLHYPEILSANGIIGPRYAIIMFEDEEGNRIKAPLLPLKGETTKWFEVQEELPAHLVPPYDAIHPRLWINHLAESNLNFLYAGDYPSDKTMWKNLVKQLKTKLKQNPAGKVLIDLRQNDTENYLAGSQLIKLVAKSVGVKRGGKIYVAIGRQTYAAATLDAVQWRGKYGAMLLGETTGANPNGYRENKVITLTHSGIRIFVPTKEYQTIENHVGGLAPDQFIPVDWNTYRNGIDPVLEWVRKQ